MNKNKIVIFGSAGTGTSSTGKLLAKKLNYEFKSTGNLMREKAEELKLSIYEFDELCKTQPKYDTELDLMVKKYGESHENFVFESRLAWYFIEDSLKIYFKCDENLIYTRIAKRENLSLEDARVLTLRRNEVVAQRYLEIYPNIIYPPSESQFDLIVDTTFDSIEDSVNKILDFLKKEIK